MQKVPPPPRKRLGNRIPFVESSSTRLARGETDVKQASLFGDLVLPLGAPVRNLPFDQSD